MFSILSERIPLGEPGGEVLDQVERPQLPERGEELLDLVFVQVVGDPADEQLVVRVRDHGADYAWHVGDMAAEFLEAAAAWQRLVVARTSQLERLSFEADAVECHGRGGLVDGSTLEEGEVLVAVDMAGQDGVALGLRQTVEMHLLVEEVDHLVLVEPEGQVSDVDSSGLTGDGASYNCNSGLNKNLI